MIDIVVAHDKLRGFETADGLAEFFKGECVVGIRSCTYSCPIAQWIQTVTGQCVSVNPKDTMTLPAVSTRMRLENSNAMTYFVEAFDEGDYPELEEKGIYVDD